MEISSDITLIIIMLGTNDLLQGNSVATVTMRMKGFLENIDPGKAEILLIAPPSMQLGEWVPNQAMIDASKELTQQYEALSQQMSVQFVDADKWSIPICFDGVHLTEEGHNSLAEGVYDYITMRRSEYVSG